MRKFHAVLVVLAGLLLGACAQAQAEEPTVSNPEPVAASPTSQSTMAPTATPEPTVIPTEVPTPTPTEVPTLEPTPVPTEVPMYVGLTASEVEALRTECLQANPDSACLPLPFEPTGAVQFIAEADLPGMWVADGQGEDHYLAIDIPVGTDLPSPLGGELWVRGEIPGYDYRWLDRPGRSIVGLTAISFGFGPFVSYDGFNKPTFELRVSKGACTETDNRFRFEEGNILVFPQHKVMTGDVLAKVEVPACLRIYAFDPVVISVVIPEGRGIWTGLLPMGRTDLSDLLTTSAGSIVYVLPPEG